MSAFKHPDQQNEYLQQDIEGLKCTMAHLEGRILGMSERIDDLQDAQIDCARQVEMLQDENLELVKGIKDAQAVLKLLKSKDDQIVSLPLRVETALMCLIKQIGSLVSRVETLETRNAES